MSKKLSVDQTYKFVTLYKERRCLWDIKSKNYKNKRLREIALKQICKEMGIDNFHVEDVKTKIKSIRSTYYLELDKIKRSITSGYSNGKVYESKIKWFAELDSFIRKVMVKRKTDDNGTHSIQPEPENKTTATLCSEIQSPVPKTKKSEISQLSSSMKSLQGDICTVEEEEDEFDVFGKHITKQLRKLSSEQGIMAQKEIQSVITKYRLNDLQSQKSTLTWSSTLPDAYALTPNIQTVPTIYTLLPQNSPALTIKEEEEKIY